MICCIVLIWWLSLIHISMCIRDRSYADICNAEGKLPSGYDSGASWVMSKATFFSQVIGMVDANGQPVARVSAGINGKPEYRLSLIHI